MDKILQAQIGCKGSIGEVIVDPKKKSKETPLNSKQEKVKYYYRNVDCVEDLSKTDSKDCLQLRFKLKKEDCYR